MGAVSRILLHQVGEIGRRDIQALRQQSRDQERGGGLLVEKRGGGLHLVVY